MLRQSACELFAMFSPPASARVKPQGFKPAPAVPRLEDFTPPETWLDAFKEFEDPRREKRTWHQLLSIIGLAFLAVLCGADHWEQIEVYARSKQRWRESARAIVPETSPCLDGWRSIYSPMNSPIKNRSSSRDTGLRRIMTISAISSLMGLRHHELLIQLDNKIGLFSQIKVTRDPCPG